VNGQIQYGPAPSMPSLLTHRDSTRRRLAEPARFQSRRLTSPLTLSIVSGVALTVALIAVPRPAVPTALLLLGAAWVSLMLAMTLPGRAQRAGDELTSRRARFRHAVNGIGDTPTRAQLEEVVAFARGLDLREEEIADDLDRVRASMAALTLLEEISVGQLPVVAMDPPLRSGGTCHFLAPVCCGRRRSDEHGHLQLTTDWLRFTGPVDASVAWSQVIGIQRAGTDLIVTIEGRHGMFRFTFRSVEEAARCGVIAGHLRALAASVEAEQRPYSAMM